MEPKIKIDIRPAEINDFSYVEWGEKRRKIGMAYFLRNSEGNLECYYINQDTDARELAQFIKEGRCFVLKQQELMGGKMVEEIITND